MTKTAAEPPHEPSDKFRRKRDLILDAASVQINRHGVRGLTFAGVAQAVGLNTSSVTYYFKRKELLASATYEREIARWQTMIDAAATAETPRARVRALVHSYLAQVTRTRAGDEPQLTLLSDIRAMEDASRTRLIRQYQRLLWGVASFWGAMPDTLGRAGSLARAQILLDNLHWSRTWLPLYSDADFPRVEARLCEYFENGFAPPSATWAPTYVKPDPGAGQGEAGISRETYLRAATVLINERGYRGASVERIAAHLKLSKGSFYHHLSGKDDLVLECFDRSYSRVSSVQYRALHAPGDYWQRLTSTVEALLSVQFDADFPLLRTTALQALPKELRLDIIRRSNRMAQRFAGMMIDGITQSSIRPVDPLIVSQCLMAGLNAAHDFQFWARGKLDLETAIQVYATPLVFGLFHGQD